MQLACATRIAASATKGRAAAVLQHFTGTLDNWDPAIVDVLARDREIILFDNAGVGRSGGQVPTSIAHMAQHVLHFVDALSIDRLHILGFSLGGFRAGHRDRPTGTGRAVDPVRHRAGRRRRRGMDRPELLAIYTDGEMPMSEKLERLFSRQRPRPDGRRRIRRPPRRAHCRAICRPAPKSHPPSCRR